MSEVEDFKLTITFQQNAGGGDFVLRSGTKVLSRCIIPDYMFKNYQPPSLWERFTKWMLWS